jgi:urease accessory protein
MVVFFLFVYSFRGQVTNDIFTKEDGEFLIKHGALPEERIRAVETGGCPHAAIREDISINLGPLEELSNLYKADLLLCESGGGIFHIDSTK